MHGAVSRAHAERCSADGCTNTSQRKGLCRYHHRTTKITLPDGFTPYCQDGEHQKKFDEQHTELFKAEKYIAELQKQLKENEQRMSNFADQLETAKRDAEGYKKEIELKDSTMNDLRRLLETRDRDFVILTDKTKELSTQLLVEKNEKAHQQGSAQKKIDFLNKEIGARNSLLDDARAAANKLATQLLVEQKEKENTNLETQQQIEQLSDQLQSAKREIEALQKNNEKERKQAEAQETDCSLTPFPINEVLPSSEWDSNKRKTPGFPSDANSKRWKSSTIPPFKEKDTKHKLAVTAARKAAEEKNKQQKRMEAAAERKATEEEGKLLEKHQRLVDEAAKLSHQQLKLANFVAQEERKRLAEEKR